jgi:DNA-binding IclR family transcriptional regulator
MPDSAASDRKRRAADPTPPRKRAERPPTVKSADRVLDLLELLAGAGRAMSHAELARRTAIPKGSLTPLLRNLVERGYVEQVEGSLEYQLGERAYALARRGAHNRDLVRVSQPWLARLVRLTGESASVSVLRDDMADRIAAAETSRAVLYSTHVGVLAPLYANSAGKVLLAWMPPAEREAYLRRVKLQPRTDKTIRSLGVLRRQLQTVREEGLAWSFSEFTAGVVGMAVPVLDAHGRAIAAIGLALPEDRLDEARKLKMLEALRAAAREIGRGVDGSATASPAGGLPKSVHI